MEAVIMSEAGETSAKPRAPRSLKVPRPKLPRGLEAAKATAMASLCYDAETGHITWTSGRRSGRRAERKCQQGYLNISINGRRYRAHRVAWLLAHGDWPSIGIDHINGERSDNRIVNLRLATQAQNCANARCRRDNRSGIKGVHFHKKSKKWRAAITHQGRSKSLGYFDTAEAAADAYAREAKAIRGEFARVS